MVSMRLQKFLARSGVASRRGSENLMTAGRVKVNGVVVTGLGTKVDPSADVVTVDDRLIDPGGEPVYLMLNKPVGYITSMGDPFGRPTVAELVPDDIPGLFPVGRLDMDTTGLLLFTTDGAMGYRLLHPSFHVSKVYLVEPDRPVTDEQLEALSAGVMLDDTLTLPATARRVSGYTGIPRVELVITEGRKRQVRRMFTRVGNGVAGLHRAAFGPLRVDGLQEGAWRHLTETEVQGLRELMDAEKESALP